VLASLSCGCLEPPRGVAHESTFISDTVIEAPGADPARPFGDPQRAVNGIRGAGSYMGSFDVYSLDYDARPFITLGFEGGARVFVDGPGADLVVFENGFQHRGADTFFMDPVIVEVSADGSRFVALPHRYVPAAGLDYDDRPSAWEGFAGTLPVITNIENDWIDPFDPRAGGNAFDLAELGDSAEARALRTEGVRFVRLSSAAIHTNPDTGRPYPRDATSNGADIDGIAVRFTRVSPP
jgi:hypothetical protein